MSRRRIVTIALILIVLLVKAYYVVQFQRSGGANETLAFTNGDAGHYLKIAKNLAEFGVYGDNQSNTPTEYATWRPPGWPLILAVFFWFTNDLVILISLKIALELVIGFWALTRLKKRFNLSDGVYFALFLIFLEPHSLKYGTTFLTESLSAMLMFALVVAFWTSVGKKIDFLFPLFCAILILCHPVTVFFVAALFTIYIWKAGRRQMIRALTSIGIVLLVVGAWPLRNQLTFHKGLYLTASQGATFSKGWNDQVATRFTNVDGDLAAEEDNLKYLPPDTVLPENSPVEMSKVFQQATFKFIAHAEVSDLMQIVWSKLSSNFNPFPEKPKPGLLEKAGTAFRAVYLLNFLMLAFYAFRRKHTPISRKVLPVVFAILVGQTLMSVYIYTGLRFNAVYGITSLTCLLLLLGDAFSYRIGKIE